MDKHKKFQRPHNRTASLDGMLSDGRRLGTPTHRSYQPNREAATPSLDHVLRRSEGFYPMRQSPHSLGGQPSAATAVAPAAVLDEPILLDEVDEKAKKAKKKHYYRHKHPRLRKVLKRTGLVMLTLVLAIGIYFGLKLYITQKNLFKGGGKAPALNENIDINQLKGEGDGRINILVLGIGGPGHEGADLTDTIMLVSIDPVNNTTALLSIPRDLWVKIPADGYQKINAAYTYGKQGSRSKDVNNQIQAGLNKLNATLKPIIGVPIHYNAVIDFSAFKKAVDSVGGIEVNVPEQLYDPTIAWENNYNSVIAKKGPQRMNGAKALLYAKSRETSSDFARSERQRLVMVALKDKILSLGTFGNPVKVSGLLDSLGGGIYTDFSLGDIMRLYNIMSKIPSGSIASLDMIKPPHDLLTTANLNGLSIVQPRAGIFDYEDIQNYVRGALRDGFLAKENAPVAVYNATDTTGLATAQAKILKSFGYNVTVVDSTKTPTNPARTVLVDLGKGADKYTRNYLQQRYGVTAVTNLPAASGITPPPATRFVIIRGKDVATAVSANQN